MGKFVDDSVLDASLAEIAGATEAFICSAQPADYAGIAAVALADYVPSFTGPADGDASGRKITVDAEAGIPVDVSGEGNHIALADGVTLLYVTTITVPQALVAGNFANLDAWDIEIADPS